MSDLDQRNIWLELQQKLIAAAPEPLAISIATRFTLSSLRAVMLAYREETGEWLIKLDADGIPSRSPAGAQCTHIIRAIDLDTKVLKDYRDYLQAWEEGTVQSGQTERAYITKVLLDRL